MHFHFDLVEDLTGFTAENARAGDLVKVITKAALISDDPAFYLYSEHLSSIFLNKKQIQVDNVYQFLIIIHQDLSADLYVNDFSVLVEIKAKRDVKAGELVMQGDIADIRKVKFAGIEIKDTDKIIYCFKVGWRFGLFFDFTPRLQPVSIVNPIDVEKLDIDKMEMSIGGLRRYLSFYHVYKVLESEVQFEEMKKDGWFPFVEIIAGEYKKLTEIYQNKFDFENQINSIINSFTGERIKKITEKWWKNQIFADKKILIEAGISAYLQDNQDGYINCIKNLCTELEGILRKFYQAETGKGNNVRVKEFISHVVEKAKTSSGSEYSLLLPLPFLNYLQDVIFTNFDVEAGNIDISRNSSSHGVASTEKYTKERALQLILVLDQIYFYN
jgi:hypothetical protein